jgi:nucleoside-diphosphate-sugar epimerase
MTAFYKLYGLETISLRYFNVFGPYQDPQSEYAAVIPRFIDAVLKNKPVTIYWDGQQSRDFTFVDNIVEANLKAMKAPKSACGRVYNIALGERISLLDIVSAMEKIFNKEIKINFKPKRPGDVRHSMADITLAKRNLKFKQVVSFDKGLKETIQWYTKNLKK